MLVNDANGKHLVAPGVLYVIQKYVYKKIKNKTSDFFVFTDYFLVHESIWIFEYCIRIDWLSTRFNIW